MPEKINEILIKFYNNKNENFHPRRHCLVGLHNAIALKDAEDFATIKDMVAQTEHYSEIDARQHEVKAAKDQQEMNASAEKLEDNQKLLAKKMEELRTSEADAQSAQNFMERKSEI